MFKKLLALAAVATLGYAANAEVVEDYFYDWSKAAGWNQYVMGYIPVIKDEALWAQWPNYEWKKCSDNTDLEGEGYEVIKINGEDHYVVPCTTDDGLLDSWGIQFHLLGGGNCDTEPGQTYTLTIVAKSTLTDCTLNVPFSWGWGGGEGVNAQFTLGTEYQEISAECNGETMGASCWAVAQLPGSCKTDDNGNATQIWIKSIKITHNKKASTTPEIWDDLLTNGDAEAEIDEATTPAFSKNYLGKGVEEVIFPTARVKDGDNWVFCQDAPAVPRSDFETGEFNDDGTPKLDGSYAWKNQFWIMAPRTFAKNESFRLSFKYKASLAHNVPTQQHAGCGAYLHWAGIGEVAFDTEWQEFSKVIVNDVEGLQSYAFNLSDKTDQPVKYYFDDIKWEVLRLEEGYFVAGDFNDWDLGHALVFDYDEDAGVYTKTVGNTEMPASEIRISTRKGQDAAFNSNCLNLAVGDGIVEEEPVDFTVGNGKKIILPYAGIWAIELDEEYGQITFYTGEDGIEGVSVDNAAPVYYNLQGVKVAAPVKGQVVIVKRGNQVSKEIAR